ncbi:UNVERIFIED_CONTAM: hypothetical protein K2H54_075790 [Gekko kuhli]
MCESYSRWLLRVSVAQVCQALGWDSVQLSACDLLTDVLQRYLHTLGRGCRRYCELWMRKEEEKPCGWHGDGIAMKESCGAVSVINEWVEKGSRRILRMPWGS